MPLHTEKGWTASNAIDATPTPHREPECTLDTLEHLRDVAAIVMFHKAQVQKVQHLAGLRQAPRVSTRSTRTVLNSDDTVEMPHSIAPAHLLRLSLHAVKVINGRGASSRGNEH